MDPMSGVGNQFVRNDASAIKGRLASVADEAGVASGAAKKHETDQTKTNDSVKLSSLQGLFDEGAAASGKADEKGKKAQGKKGNEGQQSIRDQLQQQYRGDDVEVSREELRSMADELALAIGPIMMGFSS